MVGAVECLKCKTCGFLDVMSEPGIFNGGELGTICVEDKQCLMVQIHKEHLGPSDEIVHILEHVILGHDLIYYCQVFLLHW